MSVKNTIVLSILFDSKVTSYKLAPARGEVGKYRNKDKPKNERNHKDAV